MKRFAALFTLLLNFGLELVLSGWLTARLILADPARLRPGFVRFDYGDLPEGAASLLAALVTLTPGTTAVAIDLERRAFELHILDLAQAEAAKAAIRTRFLAPLRVLWGLTP